MHLTFIGSGSVGGALAANLRRAGHAVTIAARDPASASVRAALAAEPSLVVRPPGEAVRGADVVFLATPFEANTAALTGLEEALAGKVLVDCTNPVGPGVSHALGSATSGAEAVQALAPGARVVKAFTIYGYENFVDNRYPGSKEPPVMMLAGDDAAAKATVATLCEELGWHPVDTGPLANALHLEHFTLLWVKMARIQGRGAGFVWAILER